jgi:hypothetical protein
MNVWKDCSDLKSFLYAPDGRVLAEIIYGGYGTWSIKVAHKARGSWMGRDLAKAACEQIVEAERPGRVLFIREIDRAPSVEPLTWWQRIKDALC